MLRQRILVLALQAAIGTTSIAAEPEQSSPSGQAPAAAIQTTTSEAAASEPAKADSASKAAEPAKPDTPAASAAEKPEAPAEATLTAEVDLTSQRITVFENGEQKYVWPISSGTAEHPTPRGTFHAQWMAKMWYSQKYDNAPMPNAVFVHDGVAIHATYATSMLGRPASHGCIRLAPQNAAAFYQLVKRHGIKSTKVSIFGTPKWRDPEVAGRYRNGDSTAARYAGLAGKKAPAAHYQTSSSGGLLDALFGSDKPKRKPEFYNGRASQPAYRLPSPPPGYRYAYRNYDSGGRVYYVQRSSSGYYYTSRNRSGW